MLDQERIGRFIAQKRKQQGMTQQDLAQRLQISFQAVSKWENGTAAPSLELVLPLTHALNVTAEELLSGRALEKEGLSYRGAGVDIAYTDAMKREMARYLTGSNPRVLNGLGPFASLYDMHFPHMRHPVLALKSEEPGSKQKLAMEYGYTRSICHDMINHLVNDIAVMGAKPLAVLDTIICGKAEKDTVSALVQGMSEACRANECELVGGETSIQPQVLASGVYVLTSTVAGVVERDQILDGSRIKVGDAVLALASNGLHTNGYSLVRLLMDKMPGIKLEKLEGKTFLERIMEPHRPYYRAVKGLLGRELVHGMAHITGGGIQGNLCRVIPKGMCARIDLELLRVLPVFSFIRDRGGIRDEEMLATFNCGVGLVLVTPWEAQDQVLRHLNHFYECYPIGRVEAGENPVSLEGCVNWR